MTVPTATASAQIRTTGKVTVVNVTAAVRQALERAGIRQGLAVVTVPHTTCGLCLNEDEAGLKDDLVRVASHLLDPLEPREGFHHDRVDNNAKAHLAAVFIGHATLVRVCDGALALGTWQSIFLFELDGPRDRRIDMLFLGD
jgi:secondary thiamine-phosphate synthase enzyme